TPNRVCFAVTSGTGVGPLLTKPVLDAPPQRDECLRRIVRFFIIHDSYQISSIAEDQTRAEEARAVSQWDGLRIGSRLRVEDLCSPVRAGHRVDIHDRLELVLELVIGG